MEKWSPHVSQERMRPQPRQEERQAETVDALVDPDRPDEPEPRRPKESASEEREEGLPTVGSLPTSCVTPAVSPAALFMALRKMHDEVASSEKLQVRHVNMSLRSTSSSLGYSMLLHSEQNRKVICSAGFLRSPEAEAAGDDIVDVVDGWLMLSGLMKVALRCERPAMKLNRTRG
jgi:hypothetical protein